MIRKMLFVILTASFLSASPAKAIDFRGRTNVNGLDYENLERSGNGYSITLVNRMKRAFAEFYVVVYGKNTRGNVIYRQRFYVDFLEGRGEVTYFLPGYDRDVFKITVEAFQNPEFDTRSR